MEEPHIRVPVKDMATAGEIFEVWGCLKVIFPSENTLFERVSTTEHPPNLKNFRPSAGFFLKFTPKVSSWPVSSETPTGDRRVGGRCGT